MINKHIHLSTDADLSAFTYTEVYCGVGGSVTINGDAVTMAAGSVIQILVTSITGAAGIYLLGFKKIGLAPTQING